MSEININLCGNQHVCKNNLIRELFDENRKILLNGDESNAICYDGIVCERKYVNTKMKLAFLLKETNGNNKNGDKPETYEDWNYVEWIKDISEGKEPIYPTFRNIAMWSAEFYDIFENDVLDKSKYIDNGNLIVNKELIKILQKIAIVNLKKTWGGGTTSWDSINNYISNEEIKNILRQQVEIIKPDVVVCGSREVFDFARIIFGGNDKNIKTLKGNILNHFKAENAIYVNFYHPSCRKRREAVFDYAQDIFETLKQICLKEIK